MSPIVASGDNLLQDLYDIFPKSDQLSAGNNRWLYTSIKEDRLSEYVVLSSSYTYFNKSSEKIMGIERQDSFTVDISLYYARNANVSSEIYEQLIKKGDFPIRKELSFGEKSIVKLKPVSLRKMKADYQILIQNKNFLLEITTNDGFALMEFASFFDQRVKGYMYENFNIFFMDRIILSVQKDGFKPQKSEILNVNSDVAFVEISGKVMTEDGKPLEGAKISLHGYNNQIATDAQGKFHTKISFKKDRDNKIEYVKNFLMKKTLKDTSKPESPFMADVLLNYQSKTEKGYIYMDSSYTSGFFKNEMIENPIKNIKKDNNTITFDRDCSKKGSTFVCNQRFSMETDSKGVTGNFKGFGGTGTITGRFINKTTTKVFYPDQKYFDIYEVVTDKDYIIKNIDTKISEISSSDKSNSFVVFEYHPQNKDESMEFVKGYYISLNIYPMRDKGLTLYFFEAVLNNNKLSLTPVYPVSLKPSEEPAEIKFYLKDPSKKYAIGFIEGDKNKKIQFIRDTSIPEIAPKFIVESFNLSNISELTIKRLPNSLKDFSSNAKGIKKDGKNDAEFLIESKILKGELTEVEVNFKGKLNYSWSTNPNKILPNPVIIHSGTVLNKKDGDIGKVSGEKLGNLSMFLGYPDWLDLNDGEFEFIFKIDNKEIKIKGVKGE